MPTTKDLPALFPVFFIVLWFAVTLLLSFMGGWHELASRFEAPFPIEGETFRFTSMALGSGLFPVRYGNCVFVTVGHSGLYISVLFLFRFQHPPLLIPWSAIETVQPERFWARPFTAVRIRGFDKRLLFPERVGGKLMQRFDAAHGQPAVSAGQNRYPGAR